VGQLSVCPSQTWLGLCVSAAQSAAGLGSALSGRPCHGSHVWIPVRPVCMYKIDLGEGWSDPRMGAAHLV